MTSSLPDFSANPVSSPAADAASLATLFPPAGSDAGAASGVVPQFAAFMGANVASGTVPESGTPLSGGPGPFAGPASGPLPAPGPNLPAGAMNCANAPTRMLINLVPAPLSPETGNPVQQTVPAFGLKVALAVSNLKAAAPGEATVASTAPATPAGRREITRDMLEEAVTFVTSLLQAVLPEVRLPQFSAVTANGQTTATTSAAPAATTGNPAGAVLSPTPTQTLIQTADATPGLPDTKEKPAAPSFTLAADGAIELKLDLAQFKPAGFKRDLPPDLPVTINAELQRPGQAVVRLEAAAVVPASVLPASDASASDTPPSSNPAGRAIFAANFPGLKIALTATAQPGERNFVFTGDKQVKTPSPLAGISVAKSETTMPVAPIEEPRFTRNPEPSSVLPQRVDFQVVVPPAERITVPAAAPAGQNFAERAVDTVTSLVDTQFSASMQKSGSVQLRLRFGGEDLSVRVEIRDGAVHTDFHTDSSELRSALTREWQAVTAQSPEQMARYLEPVFSPAPPSVPATAETPSFFGRHQQQSQQDQPSRTPREAWAEPASPFSRRSQLSDSFIPEPVVTRGPAFLPTSLRLSVHA